MSFTFPQLGTKRGEIALVLYIGEHSIDFIVLEITSTGVSVKAQGMNVQKNVPLEEALTHVFDQIRDIPVHRVVASFSSEIFKAHILREKFMREPAGVKITDKESQTIEKEIREHAEQKMRKKLLEDFGILPSDFRRNSIEILERRIDGYAVDKFAGLKGKKVECIVSGSFVLENRLRTVSKFAERQGIRKFELVHIMSAIQKYALEKQKKGVYLDIGSEHTQIGVWNNGKFDYDEGIAVGGDQFREIFGEVLGMHENIAEEFQEQYFAGDISDELRGKVRSLLLPEVKNFATLIARQLTEMKTALPEVVWFFGSGSKIHDVVGMFESESKTVSPFFENPKMAFLLPKDVQSVEAFPYEEDPRYTSLFLFAFGSLF